MPIKNRLALRTFLISSLLLVLLPIVTASGWLIYRSVFRATDQFAQQLADEVSGRIHEKVTAFFDVPQRVVSFNVEMARAGFLNYRNHQELLRQFILEIRQQPHLSIISMGMTDGEYFGGSRSPIGGDQAFRMLQSRIGNGRTMEIFAVDGADLSARRISTSDINFDARTRPWYQAAVTAKRMSWYAPYRYFINDVQGDYASLGMGVSAPVMDENGVFVGVVAADVALSQLNGFLKSLVAESGGLAFLADSEGEILAASTTEPTFNLDAGSENYRFKTSQSGNPILSAAGLEIELAGQLEGNRFVEVSGTRHLVHWWNHQLDGGPNLTIGVIFPESQFNTPMRGVLLNILYLTLAVILAAFLFVLFATNRIMRPLVSLSIWARQLTAGNWQAKTPKSSPIRELESLSKAISYLVDHLREHAEHLEQMVALRTAELEGAKNVAEQALIDQRHFIAMLSHEVRSPLAVIDSAAQLLTVRMQHEPDKLSIVGRIRRGAARLSNFFDNCLTSDRLDSHNFTLQPAPIDVAELCVWVKENATSLWSEHPFELEVEAGLPRLHGDQVLIRIVLMNLLSNAFKYSPEKTLVTLRVWRDGGMCCFAVEDRGLGIPADELAMIFQKYRRGRGGEGRPGAGLGLAVVGRIVASHHGEVSVDSREGQWTRFVVKIPFDTRAEST